MEDFGFAAILILATLGAFCCGVLYETKRVLYWKLEWIKVEHELAKTQGREPRECTEHN